MDIHKIFLAATKAGIDRRVILKLRGQMIDTLTYLYSNTENIHHFSKSSWPINAIMQHFEYAGAGKITEGRRGSKTRFESFAGTIGLIAQIADLPADPNALREADFHKLISRVRASDIQFFDADKERSRCRISLPMSSSGRVIDLEFPSDLTLAECNLLSQHILNLR